MKNKYPMKRQRESTGRKVYMAYALAIVLPSLVLGILAFRGIKNDQALVERELRISSRELGQKIREDSEQHLISLERDLLKISDKAVVSTFPLFMDSSMLEFVNQNELVEGLFYHNPLTGLSILNKGMIYQPEPFPMQGQEFMSRNPGPRMEAGWQLEYVQHDYTGSIDYYTMILQGTEDHQNQGEAQNAIARVYRKAGRPAEAIQAYAILHDSFSNVYINGNLPLGMVSLMETGRIYLEQGDTLKSLESINELMKYLEESRWAISYATYSNLLAEIDGILASFSTTGTDRSELLESSRKKMEHLMEMGRKTGYLLALPEVFDLVSSRQTIFPESPSRRLYVKQDQDSYLLYWLTSGAGDSWGLVYNQDYLLQEVLQSSLMDHSGKLNCSWELLDPDGKILLRSAIPAKEEIPVNIDFSGSLPPWTLAIYPAAGGFFRATLDSNQGIFFFIFLLIICILIFGLLFTLSTVRNELQLSRMKSNFISTVSHEFKSPLTTIRQMAEMLDSGRVSRKMQRQKYYSALLKESERLSLLIENILDFSNMEEGKRKFHFEKGNLAELTEIVITSTRSHSKFPGMEIDFQRSRQVPDTYFDSLSMTQVIQNLIDNACKYSGDSKRIEVAVLESNSSVRIIVKDYGIGIGKDEQDKIFSRFYRAGDELTQKIKGSGIGLTIVKQIVEAHRGEITLASEPGRGSEFQVILPLNMK